MNRDKELKILKMIDRIAEEIQMVGQTLDGIEGVMTCARNSKFEFLRIGHLLKLDNQKKEQEKWPGIRLLEWCREYSRKQIEQMEKESER